MFDAPAYHHRSEYRSDEWVKQFFLIIISSIICIIVVWWFRERNKSHSHLSEWYNALSPSIIFDYRVSHFINWLIELANEWWMPSGTSRLIGKVFCICANIVFNEVWMHFNESIMEISPKARRLFVHTLCAGKWNQTSYPLLLLMLWYVML